MKLLLIAAVALSVATQANAQSTALTNTMNEPIKLWVWKNSKWDDPLYIGKGAQRLINLKTPGKYYIVIRDELQREQRMGWVDLHEFAGRHIALDVLYETRGKADALAVGQGLITYGWNPTNREKPARVSFVPYFPGVSQIECVEQFEINPVTGDAVKHRYHSVRTPLAAP